MNQIAEHFNVDVNNETYTITRVLEDRNDKNETYSFKTVINGNEVKLSAQLQSEVITDLYAQNGIGAIKELTDVLLTEFRLEIAKLKVSR